MFRKNIDESLSGSSTVANQTWTLTPGSYGADSDLDFKQTIDLFFTTHTYIITFVTH